MKVLIWLPVLLLLVTAVAALAGRDVPPRRPGKCDPYATFCTACVDCTQCGHCAKQGGFCSVCLRGERER